MQINYNWMHILLNAPYVALQCLKDVFLLIALNARKRHMKKRTVEPQMRNISAKAERNIVEFPNSVVFSHGYTIKPPGEV